MNKYIEQANLLDITPKVHFLWPRPVNQLRQILVQADIVVSPRSKGSNTPMKLYSYLHSGTVCLLTDLASHTQVVSDDIALLARPDPEAFSEGMLKLVDDENLRLSLGAAAKLSIQRNNSFEVFARTANELFDWLSTKVTADHARMR